MRTCRYCYGTVVVPNAKLAGSHFVNYHLPSSELAVLVQVGVHYDSDLREVERISIEVAKEVMQEVSGGMAEFEPFIRSAHWTCLQR